jgi:hypothetical protein
MGRKLQVILLGILIVPVIQGQKNEVAHQQTEFSEESPIQRPVPLPPDVYKLLLQRTEVKQDLPFFDSGPVTPDQLFTAAEIHLNSASKADLVVAGIPPMTGADNDWYWIVCSVHGRPRMILFLGCNSFEILKTMTNGYHDIRSFWVAGSGSITRTYKFNGVRYKVWRAISEEDVPCEWQNSHSKHCSIKRRIQ